MNCVSSVNSCPYEVQDMVGMKLLEYVDVCYEYS